MRLRLTPAGRAGIVYAESVTTRRACFSLRRWDPPVTTVALMRRPSEDL